MERYDWLAFSDYGSFGDNSRRSREQRLECCFDCTDKPTIPPMTDITSAVNELLLQHHATPVLKRELDIDALNSFLQEAYSIVGTAVGHHSPPPSQLTLHRTHA